MKKYGDEYTDKDMARKHFKERITELHDRLFEEFSINRALEKKEDEGKEKGIQKERRKIEKR